MFFHPKRGYRVLHAVPVLVVLAMFLMEYISFNFVYIKTLVEEGSKLTAAFACIVFHVLFLLAICSYWQCVRTDPGGVPVSWAEHQVNPTTKGEEESEEHLLLPGDNRYEVTLEIEQSVAAPPAHPRFCKKCRCPKPERAHHCSSCDRCILRMDHHCPWVGNCVGFSNHKFFLLFLLYALLACAFISACLGPLFLADLNPKTTHTSAAVGAVMLVSLVISLSVAIALFGFLWFHIYLITSNRTTIEMQGVRRNPYTTKSWRKNVEQVFGQNAWSWLLPVQVVNNSCDGIHFTNTLLM
eukprot:GILJ01005276.1.p1 GENE.GILJ01005276.1~~GILJ01005276.1.p1  ORF type:complete len:297 (+),score=22.94 GILJ01005276.1:41-931(+)